MFEEKPDHKKKNKFKYYHPNGSNTTFKKKKTYFVWGKSSHHAP